MKKSITLFAAMFLVVVIAFGQKTELQKKQIEIMNKINKQLLEQKDAENLLFLSTYFTQSKNVKHFGEKNPNVEKQTLDSIIVHNYNSASDEWEDSKRVYLYDENTKHLQTLALEWDTVTDQFVNSSLSIFSYQEASNTVQDSTLVWVSGKDGWEPSKKTVYTFNGNHQLIEKGTYDWIEDQAWGNLSEEEYTYTATGNLAEKCRFVWVEDNFVNDAKSVYSYDGEDLLTEVIGHSWNEDDWKETNKDEYTYENSNPIVIVSSYWNEGTSEWTLTMKRQNIFDVNSNITHVDYYLFVVTWLHIWQVDYEYDLNYLFSDMVIPFYENPDFFPYHNMITDIRVKSFNFELQEWKDSMDADYIYSLQVYNSINENLNSIITAYPNPAKDNITFEVMNWDKDMMIEIFDVQGKKLISKQIKSNYILNVNELETGVYLYKIKVDNKIVNGKFIKE